MRVTLPVAMSMIASWLPGGRAVDRHDADTAAGGDRRLVGADADRNELHAVGAEVDERGARILLVGHEEVAAVEDLGGQGPWRDSGAADTE